MESKETKIINLRKKGYKELLKTYKLISSLYITADNTSKEKIKRNVKNNCNWIKILKRSGIITISFSLINKIFIPYYLK